MNLIDGVVKEVIQQWQFTAPSDWSHPGKVYDVFKVVYVDEGGESVTELWFDAELHRGIKPGYIFQH